MPMRAVTVRRWEVVLAFVALAVAYVIGLWALTKVVHADHAGRAARIAELHAQDVRGCKARRQLSAAIQLQNKALVRAETESIRLTKTIKHFPGLTDDQLRAERLTGDHLLADLRKAHRLAVRADCRKLPPPITVG